MSEEAEVVPLTPSRRYYLKNKEVIKAKQKARYEADKEKWKEDVSRRYREDTSKAWAANLRRKFGVTAEQYHQLLVEQQGVGGICGQPERATRNGWPLMLAVDHNHETGEVRGLLCRNCNVGLGHFDDKPELMEKAIAYVKERNGRTEGTG